MKTALVFGASGFIGSYLLDELLKNPNYDQVTVVVRKNLSITHPKLKVLLGDLATLPALKEQLRGDDVFIAIGTTRKQTPSEAEYYKIDHDYPVLAARFAKENGAKAVCVVTAVGADPRSPFFYVRTKGEAERDIIALNLDHTLIFRPSMLLGQRKEDRPIERGFIRLWMFINPMLVGPLETWKGIDGRDVAKAMVQAAQRPTDKVKVYQWKEMNALLHSL